MANMSGFSSSMELVAASTAFLATTRIAAFRHVKRYALPLGGGAFLLYRLATHDSANPQGNLLTEIVRLAEALSVALSPRGTSSTSPSAAASLTSRLLQDTLGLILASTVLSSLATSPLGGGGGGGGGGSSGLYKAALDLLYTLVQDLPTVRAKVNQEAAKLEAELEADLKVRSRAMALPQATLPLTGLLKSDILGLMKTQTALENVVWQQGRVSGAVYLGSAEHNALLNEAFGLYSIANPLHPDVWPSAMKFESEVISMTAALVSGGCDTVCGCTTSGGTESIILAIKAHRDFYEAKFGITAPQMVCCTSAHAAVDKACDMLKIKLIKVPMDADYRADVAAFTRAIGPNTILLYASAPSYPQGAIDDIPALSALARRHSLGLHVDCCLGGFVLPFMKKLGGAYKPTQEFDFSLAGVTSMSLDTHKVRQP